MKKREKAESFPWMVLLILLIIGIFFPANSAYGKETTGKKVLFISSYSESFMTVPEQIKGIKEGFGENNVGLDIEYMDTKRFDTLENINNFYTSLKYKIDNATRYNAIIVGDDTALQFAMDHQEELFLNIPIIFLGINDKERAQKADENPYVTGILEETSLGDNISIARKINPKATKVVAIVDNTLTGQGDQKQFESATSQMDGLSASVLNISDYTFEEFGSILGSISNDTILLFLSMNLDKTNTVMDMESQYKLICEYTKVPVYRASYGGVGEGLLGGKMISYVDLGKEAAEMVLEVLNGTDVSTIPMIQETPYYYYFDYNIIKKYNIQQELLPQGTILLNKKVSPLECYRAYIISAAIIILFLSVIAVILVIDNIKRRKIQKQLQESNEELGMIYEELTASEEELKMQYNIVEKHAQEANLLYQKYDIAITSTNSAVWELDVETNAMEISSNIQYIVNNPVPVKGELHTFLEKLVHPDYQKKVLKELQDYIAGEKKEIYIQIAANEKEGKQRWFLVRGKGIKGTDIQLKKIYGIILDTTKMKEQEAFIEFTASHDYLTRLPNRMNFMEILSDELENESYGAVILFDLDDFKSINDTLGHVYGDELLKQIANRLNSFQNEMRYVSRMGGDEFLILLKSVSNQNEVDIYMDKMKQEFSQVFSFGGMEDSIHFSAGITFYPKDSDNMNQLIMNADTAMYKAKKGGKNSWIYYHEDMKKEMKVKKEIEVILKQAIKEEGFCLYYQPQVEVRTGEIVGFEALLRLKGHSIGPDLFIPVAEETGYIIEIGRWVAKEAIKQMACWKQMGYPEKMVAINYSGKQMRDKNYIIYVRQLLEDYDIKPNYLEFEITEGILVENNAQTLEFIQELKDNGFQIALDDFGTGYSSLNYLTYIPVDKIKLDKSINDKFLEFENSKVMESLILLVHSLDMKITAEGIEDMDKLVKLKKSGCDFIQGYLFSKPLKKEEVKEIYQKNYRKIIEEI